MNTARMIMPMSDHDEDETVRPCSKALVKIGDATRCRVLKALRNGAAQTAEIASAAHISYSTAIDALNRLESRGLVVRRGLYRSKWVLKVGGDE